MRILAKVGGAQIESAEGRAALARSVASACERGHELILVHGGGNQIRALSKRLGLADRYHDGLRITDAATAEVVLMVLAGSVNKMVVHALAEAGVRACGLTGADGATFTARKLEAPGVDLGFVGAIDRVDDRLVTALLRERIVPVLATTAPCAGTQQFFNINADLGAGPLARAFAVDALLFLTDVPGVLDADKRLLARLSARDCAALRASGVVSGGMIPKVDAALGALAEHPRALVKIVPASGTDAVLAGLGDAVGTRFVMDSSHG